MDPNRQRIELSPAPWVKKEAAPRPVGAPRVGIGRGIVILAIGVAAIFMAWLWAQSPASSQAESPPIHLIPLAGDPDYPDMEPSSVRALREGEELMDMGRHAEAVPALREAVRLEPGFADARYRLGLALVMTGDVEGAREQRVALADIDPNLSNLLANLIR